MWIVFDDANYKPYGPFDTEGEASAWLEKQGITEPYGDQEVSVMEIQNGLLPQI